VHQVGPKDSESQNFSFLALKAEQILRTNFAYKFCVRQRQRRVTDGIFLSYSRFTLQPKFYVLSPYVRSFNPKIRDFQPKLNIFTIPKFWVCTIFHRFAIRIFLTYRNFVPVFRDFLLTELRYYQTITKFRLIGKNELLCFGFVLIFKI
jgi:hypothetical protein